MRWIFILGLLFFGACDINIDGDNGKNSDDGNRSESTTEAESSVPHAYYEDLQIDCDQKSATIEWLSHLSTFGPPLVYLKDHYTQPVCEDEGVECQSGDDKIIIKGMKNFSNLVFAMQVSNHGEEDDIRYLYCPEYDEEEDIPEDTPSESNTESTDPDDHHESSEDTSSTSSQALAHLTLTAGGTWSTNVAYGSSQTINYAVYNEGNDTATNLEFDDLGSPYSLSDNTCGDSLSAGNSCSIMVTFNSPGPYNATVPLILSYNDGDEVQSLNSTLTAEGISLSLTLSPIYPSNSLWNDYVRNDDNTKDVFHQDDDACVEKADLWYSSCIHGGEKRKVVATGFNSCNGITFGDNLGVFNWYCNDSADPIEFYTAGLKQDKGLADLINSTGTGWKNNYFAISISGEDGDTEVAVTPNEAWWTNTVSVLPDSSSSVVTLNSAGTIYTLPSSATSAGYNINANKIGVVTLGTNVLAANISTNNCSSGDGEVGSGTKCLISAGSQNFLWLEGIFNGGGSSNNASNVMLAWAVTHSVFRRLAFYNCNSTAKGLKLEGATGGSENNKIYQVRTANCNTGLSISNSKYNIFAGLTLNNSGYTAISISSGADYNIFSNFTLAGNDQGISNSGSGKYNTFSHGTIVNNGGTNSSAVVLQKEVTLVNILGVNSDYGVNHYSSGTTGLLMSHLAFSNNRISGVKLSTTSTNNSLQGPLLLGSNSTYNCEVDSSTNPGLTHDTCTSSGTNGSSDFPSNSGGATLQLGVDATSSFVGKVTSDQANNSNSSGTYSYASISDWLGFENRWRGWGKDGGTFPDVENKNCGSSEICRIWDFRLRSTDTYFLNINGAFAHASPCPNSASGGNDITDDSTNTFLKVAWEIMEDGMGDDDGLCESDEACIYSPNIGSYQGEGDFLSKVCSFSDGAISGVKMYAYPDNGVSL